MNKLVSGLPGRIVLFVWTGLFILALLAPWPYVTAGILFATFVTFTVLDELSDREPSPRYARRPNSRYGQTD